MMYSSFHVLLFALGWIRWPFYHTHPSQAIRTLLFAEMSGPRLDDTGEGRSPRAKSVHISMLMKISMERSVRVFLEGGFTRRVAFIKRAPRLMSDIYQPPVSIMRPALPPSSLSFLRAPPPSRAPSCHRPRRPWKYAPNPASSSPPLVPIPMTPPFTTT